MTREWINDKRSRANQPFCGVDGEGGDIGDDDALFGTRHAYQLLRAGEFCIESRDGLQFEQCASFLCSLPQHRIYVGYFFDYDVTMMLRSIPEERARRIMNRPLREAGGEGFGLLPVDVGEYQVDYLPHKEFKVRRKGQPHFTVISDVGQFFQSAFLQTLERWGIGTPEQMAQIKAGKADRSQFTWMTDEIRYYNRLEIKLLEDLMEQYRAICTDVGYVPRKWQGPGYLASAMLTEHKVPKRKDIPIMRNEEFRGLANEAYYGGRFETTACGPVRGPVYQYDINSAYPATMRQLPCLHHGSWKRVNRVPDQGTWFGEVHFSHPAGGLLHHFPVRDKRGGISYPRTGQGVYWSREVLAGQAAGAEVAFLKGWQYERHCECRWFDWVEPVYAYRKSLGKSHKGLVLKLALNSLYGKTAQSIGYAPWANPVWAGMITAGCRAELVSAYSQAPDSCVMLATDGLFTTTTLDLPLGGALGEWEETVHEDGIFIVQPGIYFMPGTDVKTRGVERGRIAGRRADFESAWEQYTVSGKDTPVSVAVDNFVTVRQALSRGKWRTAGSWEHTARAISFDWSTKRVPGVAQLRDGSMRTLPLEGGARSVGYDRIIGGQSRPALTDDRYRDIGLVEAERMAEQPDWVEPLIED